MNSDVLARIEEFENANTLDGCENAILVINNYIEKIDDESIIEKLEFRKMLINVQMLQLQIEALASNDYKTQISLRGKLINLYKAVQKKCVNQNDKFKYRHLELEEIKLQKETIKKYKKDSNSKISIPEKIGLNVLDISKSIEIFMKEKDVLTKAKNVLNETAVGTISSMMIVGVGTFILQKVTGVPFNLINLVRLCPVIAYIGLSSILRNAASKTPFEQYEYQMSEEFKEIVKEFTEKNQDLLNSISELAKQKGSTTDNEQLIEMNNQLVIKLDELIKATDERAIQDTFALQALSSLRENVDLCQSIRDEYLDEINDDKEKFDKYTKLLKKLKFEIFKRGNSIGNAIKDSGKSIVKNTVVMVIAKTILSVIAPEYFAIDEISDYLEPFAFAVINGLVDIPTYQNKLKYRETEYEGKVKTNHKERIRELLGMTNTQPVMA